MLQSPAENTEFDSVLFEDVSFEEDGTAGAWEGSGSGANFSIYHIDASVSPGIPELDPENHSDIIRLEACSAETDSYNHCSCYGPEECVSFSSSTNPEAVMESLFFISGIDFVKTNLSRGMGGNDIIMLDSLNCYEQAELRATESAMASVFSIYVPTFYLTLGSPAVSEAIRVIQNWWKHSIYWNTGHPVGERVAERGWLQFVAGPAG